MICRFGVMMPCCMLRCMLVCVSIDINIENVFNEVKT